MQKTNGRILLSSKKPGTKGILKNIKWYHFPRDVLLMILCNEYTLSKRINAFKLLVFTPSMVSIDSYNPLTKAL